MKAILLTALALCFLGCSDSGSKTTGNSLQPAASAVSACPEVVTAMAACTNHQGSEITLSGTVTWPGLGGTFILRNNVKGTHEAIVGVFHVELVNAGELVIDKEPVEGGAGGNPHIWFQLTDGSGNPLGEEVYLGRCVQDGK